MGTLYIDKKGCHIKLDSNAIAFYMDGKREGLIPLEQIKRVIFIGTMTVDTNVLRRLSEMNVSTLFLSGRSLKFVGMLNGRIHNNGILRLRQYEKATSDFASGYAQEMVARKTKKQIDLLKEVLVLRHDLRPNITQAIQTLIKVIDRLNSELFGIDSLKGLEGSASAAYFSVYTNLFPESLNFRSRTRRPPRDPVNAMLSLCYTLLHFELVREIQIIGLDPTIGFYHQFEYGRESLACDLVEVYRTDVDSFVWHLFRERTFVSDDFYSDSERSGYYLKKSKRKDFYPIYEEWARRMRPAFTEEVRSLARRITDEKDIIPD